MERALIGWYRGVVEALLARLDAADVTALAAIAAMPMEIRGYGPVKAAAVAAVKGRVAAAMAQAGAGR